MTPEETAARKLVALFNDPQPGLHTWWAAKLQAELELLEALGIDMKKSESVLPLGHHFQSDGPALQGRCDFLLPNGLTCFQLPEDH